MATGKRYYHETKHNELFDPEHEKQIICEDDTEYDHRVYRDTLKGLLISAKHLISDEGYEKLYGAGNDVIINALLKILNHYNIVVPQGFYPYEVVYDLEVDNYYHLLQRTFEKKVFTWIMLQWITDRLKELEEEGYKYGESRPRRICVDPLGVIHGHPKGGVNTLVDSLRKLYVHKRPVEGYPKQVFLSSDNNDTPTLTISDMW